MRECTSRMVGMVQVFHPPTALLFLGPCRLELGFESGVDTIEPVTSAVVIVVVTGSTVVPGIVVPKTVAPRRVRGDIDSTVMVLRNNELEISIEMVERGNRTGSDVTIPKIVEGATVDGGIVVPGSVVVRVRVTRPPRPLGGTAVPTPDAVNWIGIGRIAVLGFAPPLEE